MADSDKKFNLSAWALSNQQMISFFMLVVVVMGILSYLNLPRNEDPAFTIKKAVVSAVWPGATVQDSTHFVTDKIEKKLQEIPYLDYLQSYTQSGKSVVFINLRDDTPPESVPEIWYQVRKKMKDMESSLPPGASEPAVNDEFDDTYGTIYGFTSDGFSGRELRDQVDKVRDQLLAVPDIGKIEVLGAQDEQILVSFSPQKIAGLGLNSQRIIQVLQAQNAVTPSGVIRTKNERITLRVSGAFTSERSLENVVLSVNGRFIPLTSIASITRELIDPPDSVFRVNGQRAIGLAISMAPTGNMLKFGQHLQEEMSSIKARLPYGINAVEVADQARVVQDAVGGFVKVLVEAIVIVLAVSFVSLGTRAGLVVAVSIPLVLAMTFTGMELADIGLQRISLGALIIALGLLVDDAMITVEAMVSRLEHGWKKEKAAAFAYESTAFPMLTGTLVMIAGFIPVGFAASSAGEYCYSLFMVVLIALISSWFVAILFSPLLGIWLLNNMASEQEKKKGRLASLHQRLLAFGLTKPRTMILFSLILLALSVVGAGKLEGEFFPSSDRPELLVNLTLPQNSTQEQTERRVVKLEGWLKQQETVNHFSSYVGSGAVRFYLPMDVLLSHENIAQLVVVAQDFDTRSKLLQDLKQYLAKHYGDIVTRVSPLELGPPVGWPLQYRVIGPDVGQVRHYATELASIVGENPGARSINLTSGEPERMLKINVNQTEARAVGLSSRDVATNLATIFSGVTISTIRDNNRLVDIVVKGLKEDRRDISTITNLQIPVGNGRTVPLRQIADVQYGLDEPIIWRRQRQSFITVQMDLAPGVRAKTLSDVLAPAVKQFASTLPNEYHVEEGGVSAEAAKGNHSVYAVLPITILVMLILLIVQLRRISRVIIAVITAPFGLIGVVAAMLPTGTPMGFVALLGVIALAGMIIRNAVILISEVDNNYEGGSNVHDAIVDATVHRARPIILTACAAILGMLPIAHQVFWAPMAYAIIGGLLIATLFTLTVLPAALKLLMDWEEKSKGV